MTVKLRRGVRNGSRACLELGPRLVEAGAASLTLHPRSAEQMYTGTADHALTAELVVARRRARGRIGRRTSRARAQAVLATTGAEAVMVGRGARAIRGHFARSSTATPDAPRARKSLRSSSSSSARPFESSASGARPASSRSSTGGTSDRDDPEAVQAGAPAARLDRGGRAPTVAAAPGASRCRALEARSRRERR